MVRRLVLHLRGERVFHCDRGVCGDKSGDCAGRHQDVVNFRQEGHSDKIHEGIQRCLLLGNDKHAQAHRGDSHHALAETQENANAGCLLHVLVLAAKGAEAEDELVQALKRLVRHLQRHKQETDELHSSVAGLDKMILVEVVLLAHEVFKDTEESKRLDGRRHQGKAQFESPLRQALLSHGQQAYGVCVEFELPGLLDCSIRLHHELPLPWRSARLALSLALPNRKGQELAKRPSRAVLPGMRGPVGAPPII
mmetsp:Transcript_6713/g.15982  ORF Transcript_6713/g.15982 Transcript_6713/m.15982 type:complete len:252 (-) Transcript_6713:57-812(-)